MTRVFAIVLVAFVSAGVSSQLNAQTASDLQRIYKERYSGQAEELLCEVVRFRTEAGNATAHQQQKKWLATRCGSPAMGRRTIGTRRGSPHALSGKRAERLSV